MGIVLAFAPFITFALVDRLIGSSAGLIAGAAVSALLLAREVFAGRSPKWLELGSLVLFGGLALYAVVAHPAWSLLGVRLLVDVGLLAIVIASLLCGRPFTLQYARERAPRDIWDSSAFRRTNVVISAAWAVAFVIVVAVDALMLLVPEFPLRDGIVLTAIALVAAFKFTAWYPQRVAAPASRPGI